ncbi:Vacuole morphology and inheritance protein 14 [Cyberlindnera fabianii]|uniref:Vacuole morphology and inheritance protein 14 n=1 Tax=Cyberlindnera fabianii TaxID=36022 RepID=A0A1V2L5I2_CYBFA|nr:Vacuole morphology and inheritance protein 14 [Cyberlindnera fabianii]
MDKTISKGLSDRLYEKRKNAALDLEAQVKAVLQEEDGPTKVRTIIDQLSRDFAYAVHQPNARNGGLIGLAASAIALGQNEVANYLEEIIHPVLACFGDQDARVRYYACESLYNIAKVAKGEILLYFNEVFDVLCRLASDSDVSVKNGADLLDRLIKDIVCEKATSYISVIHNNSEQEYKKATQATYKDAQGQTFQLRPQQDATAFNLPKFIPLLMERINVIDPSTRVFLVSWITLLNSVPDLELVSYLPAFLGGLLTFLNDSHSDVRVMTQSALDVFLHEIRRISDIQKLLKEQKEEQRKQNEQLQFDKDERLKHEITITAIESSTPDKDAFPADVKDAGQSTPLTGEQGTETTSNADAFEEAESADDIDETLATVDLNPDEKHLEVTPDANTHENEEQLTEKDGEGEEQFDHDGEAYIPGQDVHLDYPKLIEILISHMDGPEEKVQLVILTWLENLLDISPLSFVQYLPKLLSVLLVTMANDEGSSSKESANEVNSRLMEYISSLPECDEKKLNYNSTINVLTLHFLNDNETAKVASLEWLKMLHKKSPKSLLEHSDLFATLLKALSDPSEEVIYRDLQLIADISYESEDEDFSRFMVSMLDLFKKDQKLLETRGNFILRRLCISLNPVRVYQTFARVLEQEQDATFVGIIIQILNNNLITAPELSSLRKRLRNLEEKDDWEFFSTLFRAWCHNAPATLALCLLAQAYELAYSVLQIFVDFEITVNVLVQIDILVQLLESPVFTRVRLQLLEPEKYPYLHKCLYGILMLLPQSSAFSTLKNRLSSVSLISTFPQRTNSSSSDLKTVSESVSELAKNSFKWMELLHRFRSVQQAHEQHLLKGKATLTERPLPKYADTPATDVRSPADETDKILAQQPQSPKSELRSAVRKLSGRSFGMKSFGGDKSA